MEDFNLVLKRKLFVLASALFIAGGILSSDAKTLLLVPQDNRPVSLSYTVSTATKAGNG